MSDNTNNGGPAFPLPVEDEEIMVNTPYDVFTLPLRLSGLSSGPRFVVHVPGPEQPVEVEGLLQRIDAAIERVTTGQATMRIPADPTDLDLVLADARDWIKQAALAQQPATPSGDAGAFDTKGAPAGDGCHCATCTCNPSMTPAVRFDLSPAQQEGAIREHLIRLGWTPPDEHATLQVEIEALAEENRNERRL